jgi:hypothetical protein
VCAAFVILNLFWFFFFEQQRRRTSPILIVFSRIRTQNILVVIWIICNICSLTLSFNQFELGLTTNYATFNQFELGLTTNYANQFVFIPVFICDIAVQLIMSEWICATTSKTFWMTKINDTFFLAHSSTSLQLNHYIINSYNINLSIGI